MQKRSCSFGWVARLLAIVIALKAYSSTDSRFIVGTPWSKLCRRSRKTRSKSTWFDDGYSYPERSHLFRQ